MPQNKYPRRAKKKLEEQTNTVSKQESARKSKQMRNTPRNTQIIFLKKIGMSLLFEKKVEKNTLRDFQGEGRPGTLGRLPGVRWSPGECRRVLGDCRECPGNCRESTRRVLAVSGSAEVGTGGCGGGGSDVTLQHGCLSSQADEVHQITVAEHLGVRLPASAPPGPRRPDGRRPKNAENFCKNNVDEQI